MIFAPDTLDAEQFSPLGDAPLVVIDLAAPDAARRASQLRATSAILCGVDRAGVCPPLDADAFDLLLTTRAADPSPGCRSPWAVVSPNQLTARLDSIAKTVETAPVAAFVLRQVLRMTDDLSVEAAMVLESFAYSTLLGGAEFRHWLSRPRTHSSTTEPGRVKVVRERDLVTISLASPASRNAMDSSMRDALFDALAAVVDDPTEPRVRLLGTGACFSTGGALDEFGQCRDLAEGHMVRSLRSCARLLARLESRSEAILHGACVGAGIEIPAAAGRRFARANAFFQLPELGMGLIPGAGGTATMTRAIGRHRTAYMALSRRRIGACEALGWGLIHSVAVP